MNPPVDAPASRQRLPVTEMSVNASSAPSSLYAPRDAQFGSSPPRTTMAAPVSTPVAGLRATMPCTVTLPSLISVPACSRDRASPRRTSSASRRALRAIGSDPVDGGQREGQLGVHRVEPLDVLGERQPVQVIEPGHRFVDAGPRVRWLRGDGIDFFLHPANANRSRLLPL